MLSALLRVSMGSRQATGREAQRPASQRVQGDTMDLRGGALRITPSKRGERLAAPELQYVYESTREV
jgi:hypothetical protein